MFYRLVNSFKRFSLLYFAAVIVVFILSSPASAKPVLELELTSRSYQQGEPIGFYVRLKNNSRGKLALPYKSLIHPEMGNLSISVVPPNSEPLRPGFIGGTDVEGSPFLLSPGDGVTEYVHLWGLQNGELVTGRKGEYRVFAEVFLDGKKIRSPTYRFVVAGKVPELDEVRAFPPWNLQTLETVGTSNSDRSRWNAAYRGYISRYPASRLTPILQILLHNWDQRDLDDRRKNPLLFENPSEVPETARILAELHAPRWWKQIRGTTSLRP